jgi:hypothetical protein
MPYRRRVLVSLLGAALLAACSRDDPQAALEAAVQRLQDALEARDAGAVLEMLDRGFLAQRENGRDWAQRTMTLLFLRHRTVKVVALSRRSRIDEKARHVGFTEAQVLLVGADGLLPQRAAPYAVTLRWQREGGDWKLLNLEWE